MRESLVQYYNELKRKIGNPYWDMEAKHDSWPAERFREKIEECVAHSERKHLKNVFFCSIPLIEGNAFAIRVHKGGALLCIDASLQVVAFQFSFALLVASANPQLPFQPKPWKGADHMVRCAKVLKSGLSKEGLAELFSCPLAGDFKRFRTVGNEDLNKTGRVTDITEGLLLFVLLHETYHFLRGHLNDERLFRFAISDQVTVSAYTKLQNDEIESDIEALSALLRWKPEQTGYLAACVETLFLLFRLCEALGPSKLPPELRTHPPALYRLEKLREIYLSRDTKLKENVDDFNEAYDRTLELVER